MMKEYILSIEKCLEENNYHCAIFMALSIPDICGSLETPKEKNNIRAKRWFSDNLKNKYFPDTLYDYIVSKTPERIDDIPSGMIDKLKAKPFKNKLTPDLYWGLRNAFIHSASDVSSDYKIHITHGDSHLNLFNNELQISAKVFCTDVCDAANIWLVKMRDNPEVWQRITSRAEIKNSILNGMFLIN